MYGDVEYTGLALLQFMVDEFFDGVPFHFFENSGHHLGIKVLGNCAEIFQGQVICVSGCLVNAHFDAYFGGNPWADVFDHKRNDHEVGDEFDDHAYGVVEIVQPFCFIADNIDCPGCNFLLLLVWKLM